MEHRQTGTWIAGGIVVAAAAFADKIKTLFGI